MKNNFIKKWAEDLIVFKKRNAEGQQAWEKMFASHQENTNQNHKEISPHTCQNGYHQKERK